MSLVFQPIVSSNLHSAALDLRTGDIVVRFKNGSQGRYEGARPKWSDFQKTFDGKDGRSAGKFLNAQLKAFPYERLEDWTE